MTVINPNSISGITSITLPSGDGNVLTIHTNDGVERFRIDSTGNIKVGTAATISPDGDLFVTGVCTATTLSGAASGLTGALPAISAANLTNVPAANITGTLPAISAANLTNVPAANITGTLPAIDGSNLTGIGGTDFIHAEQISVSGVTTSQAFIPSQGQLSHRNLIINGDMRIAQRATSSTSTGYQTIDRMRGYHNGADEAPTYAQGSIGSSDTGPYEEGFRTSFKITNGNQTSGAGVNDSVELVYFVEAQDLATCGWNYTSSSSFITLSFWIKSSVAQNFHGHLTTQDGTQQNYPYETGSLTADTWTKITKTIPGNSNLQFDNDVNRGLSIKIVGFRGTTYTGSGSALNTWATYASGSRMPDNTSTWYTTNDATLEITGLQLEVGQVATPFEHKKFGEELSLCQRYYQRFQSGGDHHQLAAAGEGSSSCKVGVPLTVPLRASPTVACGSHRWYRTNSVGYTGSTDAPTSANFNTTVFSPVINLLAGGHTTQNNEVGVWTPYNGNDLIFDSEL